MKCHFGEEWDGLFLGNSLFKRCALDRMQNKQTMLSNEAMRLHKVNKQISRKYDVDFFSSSLVMVSGKSGHACVSITVYSRCLFYHDCIVGCR